jgi:hypothetical protein
VDGRAQFRVAYDAGLVEEAVLLAEQRLSEAEAAGFRAERDRIYGTEDDDEREARFEELHGRYFLQLRLDRPLQRALADRPELMGRARACRVLPAPCARDEAADVLPGLGAPATDLPTIAVRLRARSLLDPETLRAFLRRELLHVADMLDPAFEYERELPAGDDDPALINLVRERYRVLWDASVDGRLVRDGLLDARVRDCRLADFGKAFPMLESAAPAFAAWFDAPRPSHPAFVAFAREPPGPGTGDGARCPVCRLPARRLERAPSGLGVRPEQGCCARCAEVLAVYGSA